MFFYKMIKVMLFITANERWIQVMYDEEKTITAVVTQGRSTYDEYLTSFNVLYKKSGSNRFKFVTDEHGLPKVS